jgi:hypothetical protein
MRCSHYPQSLAQVCGAIRLLFIPSCPGLTGLTGVCHLWDLPRVNYLTRVFLGRGVAGRFLICSEGFASVCEGLFFIAGCVFGGVLVPGPREVTEALWNICCAAAAATGLTGSVHRSDWCHRSDQRRPSALPVQHRQQAVHVSAVRVGEFCLVRLFVGS